jgi:hypothetical protein
MLRPCSLGQSARLVDRTIPFAESRLCSCLGVLGCFCAYMEQLLHISQGKLDMRSYIAAFNALRAKIPTAFPEETLSHLFLQGCRLDLQRHITLQYPKTLAEYFQHAITLSDLPNSHKPQPNVNKPPSDHKPKTTSPLVCAHCGKPGHTEDRCFQLHPELRRRRPKASKP